jgi:DNA repair ATPase RecN
MSRVVVGSVAVISLGALYFSIATSADAQTVRRSIGVMNASSTASSTIPRVDNSCVGEAVMVREEALMEAWENFSTTTTSALTERSTALVDAWNLESTKERSAAIKAAWKNWKADSKAAHTALRKERKTAWDTFKKTVKAECRGMSIPKEEALERAKSDTITL